MSVHPNSLANLRPDLSIPWTSETAPRGRTNAGLSANEHCNALSAMLDAGKLTRNDIREIARNDPNLNRSAGAIQLLLRGTLPDIADYDDLLCGEKSIGQLRKEGLDTTAVKKLKRRKRTIKRKDCVENVIEHEIELHNRAGDSFDRVANHTEGLPIARQITQSTSIELRVERKIITADDLAAAYRKLLTIGPESLGNGNEQSVHPAIDGQVRQPDVP